MGNVMREGRYDQVRGYFLEWLAGYLETREAVGKQAILRLLRQARWDLAHPHLARAGRFAARLVTPFGA